MLYFLVLLIQNHVIPLDEQSICQGENGNNFVTVCQEYDFFGRKIQGQPPIVAEKTEPAFISKPGLSVIF